MRQWGGAIGGGYHLAWLLLILALSCYLFVYVHHGYGLLCFPFDYDQGEGYDVNSAWSLVQGLPLYGNPDEYPFYSSNYPPVYSFILAPLLYLFGPSLALGRLLSIAATAGISLIIFAAVYWAAGRGRAALAAALLFLASPYVYHVTPLARVNALTLLFALAALYSAQRAVADQRPWRRSWLYASGLLLLLALFTKQMSIDAAASIFLLLLVRNWRLAFAYAVAIASLGGAVYLLIDLLTGGGFSLNVFWANANEFSFEQLTSYYSNFVRLHLVILLVALAVSFWHWRRSGLRGISVYTWYLLASLLLAVGTGKWGAGESYFLPSIAAAVVLSGFGLAWLEDSAYRYELFVQTARADLRATLAYAACLLLIVAGSRPQLYWFWHGAWSFPQYGLVDRGIQASVLTRRPTTEDVAVGYRIATHMRSAPGDVLGEEGAFALVAGKKVLGNATQQRNLWLAERHDPAALVRLLNERQLDVVVLNAQQYPPPVLQAIGQNYHVVESLHMNGFNYLVMLPGGR